MSLEDTNKAVVRAFFDGYNERDPEAVRETLAEGFVHRNHPAAGEADNHIYGDLHDIDEYLEVEFAYFDTFPDLAYELELLIADGDYVGCIWTAMVAYDDPHDSTTSQEMVGFSGLNFIRLEDGRIAEIWGSHDDLGLYDKLGLIDAPTRWV